MEFAYGGNDGGLNPVSDMRGEPMCLDGGNDSFELLREVIFFSL
jgi:hypothetical protein